ncbi:restriction endonuclease subunit S [Staphylococcus hominis]|uniref:restriction endonuclease subunit S n=1 Tax=Staphylococcus hominis TaxID=1290 RepID=UPI00166A794D|nr:restriction endonuclease subunit S [Staphylococcus hominis]MCI2874449.1 restriction endonuclease subunit S [Staphylococcus hominis]MDS3896821.1 restriction endonuclease subunit S [Staphylococcus hominis]GGO40744.1 type I restriction endonuclease subunit S [Plantactinospora veratri]
MEFKKVKLGEISIITMGQSPKSEFYSEIDGTPFLQGNRTFQHIYPVIDTYTKKVTKLANANDILFSVRAPVGDINIAPVDLCIGRGLCAIRSINNNQEFLFYLLKSKINELESQATGTIFSSVNKKTLENFIVNIPNEKQQKNIGTILSNLDKKIELNQKIIANLEELSQILFKHWFVDFEFPDENGNPYKSSGGEMIDSELGEMPLSWKVHKLNDIFKINYGKNLPTKKILNTGYPVFGGNGIIGYYSSYMYENPKILISCRGAASGKIHISKEKSFVTNNSIVLNEKQKNYFYYFKELFKYNDFKRYTTGSAQPQITIANIKDLMYLTPDTNIIDQFNSKISSLFNQKNNYEDENQNLTQLRDTLLPKLMSGEIEIPDDVEVNMDELSI